MLDPCAHCEEMMQPYVDGVLTEAERVEAEAHLAGCSYCARRYRFEEELRHFVKISAEAEARSAPHPARVSPRLRAFFKGVSDEGRRPSRRDGE